MATDPGSLGTIIASLEASCKPALYAQLHALLHSTSKTPQLATAVANSLTSRTSDLINRLLGVFERDVGPNGRASTSRVGQALPDKEKDQLYATTTFSFPLLLLAPRSFGSQFILTQKYIDEGEPGWSIMIIIFCFNFWARFF
jgi:hypothetical protein